MNSPTLQVHPYIKQEVLAVVKEGCPGTYILGDASSTGVFVPKYVGRSDTCLRTRLLTHNHYYDYECFVFRYESSPKSAFYDECKWWHDYLGMGVNLDNVIHPDFPSGNPTPCPYCGLTIKQAC